MRYYVEKPQTQFMVTQLNIQFVTTYGGFVKLESTFNFFPLSSLPSSVCLHLESKIHFDLNLLKYFKTIQSVVVWGLTKKTSWNTGIDLNFS